MKFYISIVFSKEKQVYATSGIKDTFKLTNDEYIYENQ